MALLVVLPVALAWPGAVTAAPRPALALVETAGGEAAPGPGGELRAFLHQDTAWLDRQTTPLVAAPASDSLTTLAEWARERLNVTAAPDSAGTGSARGQRDLLARLRDRWFARGYLEARLTGEETADGGWTIRIAPGPLFRVGDVELGDAVFAGWDRLVAAVVPHSGEPFRAADWEDAAALVLERAGEAGFPFARWIVEEVAVDPAAARVNLRIAVITGPAAVVGRITSDLATVRARRFLVKASGFRRGESYRESDIARARERLEARDIYAAVDEPRLYLAGSADTIGVHFPVRERRKANRLAVVLGYARRAEEGGSLSGQIDLRLPNLAGTGRRLEAQWSDDGRERRRFGFGYLEPLALGTPLDAQLGVEQEVLTDAYTRFTVESRWQLAVVALWGLELGVAWDRNTYPAGSLERTRRLRGRVAFFHRRGSRLRSGWSGSLALEEARREAVYRAADVEEGDEAAVRSTGTSTSQRIFAGDIAGEFWLGDALSLYGRGAYRQLTGGSEPAPLAEQFRFGGARSLRGYREDEFHGETVTYGGVELRVGSPGRSRVYTFFDLGYFDFAARVATEPETYERRSDTPYGFGLGLETRTTGGDISLAVGFPRRVDFEEAKLHVTLLESF